MNNMQYELGKYEVVGPHKGCGCDGRVMRLTPLKINDNKHPLSAPNEWLWCDGKSWDGQAQTWHRCGASTLKGDRLST